MSDLRFRRKPGAKTPPAKAGNSSTGYQFKITLLGTRPAIWRRFQVPDCDLGELHEIIQCVMGWEFSHMHQFIIDEQYYGSNDPELNDGFGPEMLDQDKYKLSDIIPTVAKKFRFVYEYDFGDGWEHGIELEKRLTTEEFKGKAICLEGERACPPEDCGGVYGYAEILSALKDRKKEKSSDDDEEDDEDELIGWLDEDFDPAEFSVKEVNEHL